MLRGVRDVCNVGKVDCVGNVGSGGNVDTRYSCDSVLDYREREPEAEAGAGAGSEAGVVAGAGAGAGMGAGVVTGADGSRSRLGNGSRSATRN